MNYWTQNKDNIYVAAHRGWSSKYPENTMIAFKKAVELGVDQIETDIRVTKDGELVLHHDYELDRTTNGTGHVRDTKLSDLLTLDAGYKKGSEFVGERIPTLIEFLEYVKDIPKLTIDFELKEYPVQGREKIAYEACDKSLELIDKYGFTDRCVINTFNGKLHEYIRSNYGNKYKQHVYFPITVMGQCEIDPYSYAYCSCMFSTLYSPVNISTINDCDIMRKLGIQPWGGADIKDEKGVDLAIERGITLITCNNPDEILEILRKKGKHQ
jgi:glycerophosphoryl diester phosphodiesterase